MISGEGVDSETVVCPGSTTIYHESTNFLTEWNSPVVSGL